MTFFEILRTYSDAFRQGLLVTLELCSLVWIIGLTGGVIVGVLSARFRTAVGIVSRTVSTLLSGVPILVLLYWLYYPAQQQLQVDIPAFQIAVFAFSFINIFIVAELVRDSIENLPHQYLLAAKVCGLSEKTTLLRIQIPLIFKHVLGPILLVQISMLQNSIFASLINVDEIFRQIQRVNAMVYKPIELYTALAMFFIIITVPLNLLASYLKKIYAKDYSER